MNQKFWSLGRKFGPEVPVWAVRPEVGEFPMEVTVQLPDSNRGVAPLVRAVFPGTGSWGPVVRSEVLVWWL